MDRGAAGSIGAGRILCTAAAATAAIALLLAVGAGPVSALPAPAGQVVPAVQVVAADAVVAVPSAGATLAVPADGRLNGYGFAGQVLGVAVGRADPGAGMTAAAGQTLWVFGLSFTADVTTDSDGQSTAVQPSATVIFGGDQVTVPISEPRLPDSTTPPATISSGDQYFAASVPAQVPSVTVEMSSGGYDQSFSLSSLTRLAPSPPALYRNPGSWDSVDQLNATKALPTPYVSADGTENLPDAQLRIDLSAATVSYFGPDGATDPAPDTSQAWLYADLADPFGPDPSTNLQYQTPLVAADLSLALPGDPTVIHPKALPGGPDTVSSSAGFVNSLFADQFAFPVPATATTATLTVDVASEAEVPPGSGAAVQTGHPGTATFDLTFAAPSSPNPPPAPATHPAALANLPAGQPAREQTAGHHSSGASVWALTAIAVGLTAVIVAGLIFYRGRRSRLATAVASATIGAPPAPPTTRTSPPRPGPVEAPQAAPPVTNPSHGPATSSWTPEVAATSNPAAPAETATDRVPRPFEPPPAIAFSGPTVLVLGEIEVTGWVEKPNRQIITHLAVFLAAQDRPDNLAAIRAAVGSDRDSDQAKRSMRTNLSRLRRCLGPGHLPESAQGSGYQLQDVSSDYAVFGDLSAHAATVAESDTRTAIETYVRAVALIRGEPYFCHDGYQWVDTAHLRSQIEMAIIGTVTALTQLALKQGRADIALWAAHQGQLAAPFTRPWPPSPSSRRKPAAAPAPPGPSGSRSSPVSKPVTANPPSGSSTTTTPWSPDPGWSNTRLPADGNPFGNPYSTSNRQGECRPRSPTGDCSNLRRRRIRGGPSGLRRRADRLPRCARSVGAAPAALTAVQHPTIEAELA